MEEFSLEKYNTGDYDVVTRIGLPAKVIYTQSKGKYPIVVLVQNINNDEETIISVTLEGKYSLHFEAHHNDIFLKKKKWVPKEGETYWYISSTYGIVYEEINKKHYFDNAVIENGNCFKTQEEAEAMAERIKKLLNEK